MICEERVRLEKEHQEARATFDAQRKALQEKIGLCQREDFALLSHAVDKAWDVLHHTRLLLDEHIRQHACGNQELTADHHPVANAPEPSG